MPSSPSTATRQQHQQNDLFGERRMSFGSELALQHGVHFEGKYIGSMEIARPGTPRNIKKRAVDIVVSVDGVKVVLQRRKKRQKYMDESKMLVMSHPMYRIYYVAHDLYDPQIFSYVARDGASNSFKCNVFKCVEKRAPAAHRSDWRLTADRLAEAKCSPDGANPVIRGGPPVLKIRCRHTLCPLLPGIYSTEPAAKNDLPEGICAALSGRPIIGWQQIPRPPPICPTDQPAIPPAAANISQQPIDPSGFPISLPPPHQTKVSECCRWSCCCAGSPHCRRLRGFGHFPRQQIAPIPLISPSNLFGRQLLQRHFPFLFRPAGTRPGI
ncbi:hypothetical protein niasHS_014532 [Heterodera schachtii]|uniref:PID domain-containing protein n=1 Tax=Heterodera schachtii TaxID=97005 RepID=A0ABD2I7U9_HETSC